MTHTPNVFRPELSASTSLSQRCFFFSLSFYFTNEIIRYLGRRWNGGGDTTIPSPHRGEQEAPLADSPVPSIYQLCSAQSSHVPLCLHFPLIQVSRSILSILPLTDMSDENDDGDDDTEDDDGDERRLPLAKMDPNQCSQWFLEIWYVFFADNSTNIINP